MTIITKATVTEVSGYRVDATQGEVKFKGTNFGLDGSAVLITQTGPGSGPATVKSWTNNEIILSVAANKSYKSYAVVPAYATPVIATNLANPITTYDLLITGPIALITSVAFPEGNYMVVTGTNLDVATAMRPMPLGNLFYNPLGLYGSSNVSVTINAWTPTTIDVGSQGLTREYVQTLTLYDSVFSLMSQYVLP